MSQFVNAEQRPGLTLPAESDLLGQFVKVNRERLRSLLIRRDRSRKAAVKCLVDPNLSERLEKAARVAVALSFGTAPDRIQARSLLLTHGADSAELQSCLAESFGRIRHPAAAFLLLPMLKEVPHLVREVAFRSLLALHHPMTSESLLAAILSDHGLLDSMLLVTRRLTQRECNEIFESLEQAAIQEPRLASALQLIHSFVNAGTLASHSGHGSGCDIAAERLQRSMDCDIESCVLLEFMDNETEWNGLQAAPLRNDLAEQKTELAGTAHDVSDRFSTDVPSTVKTGAYLSFFADDSHERSPKTAVKNAAWQNRWSYLEWSRTGQKLTIATSLLVALAFGLLKYQSSLSTPLRHPRAGEQPGVLRVSEMPESEPANGLSARSTAKPSPEKSGGAEIEATVRISSSLRQRD